MPRGTIADAGPEGQRGRRDPVPVVADSGPPWAAPCLEWTPVLSAETSSTRRVISRPGPGGSRRGPGRGPGASPTEGLERGRSGELSPVRGPSGAGGGGAPAGSVTPSLNTVNAVIAQYNKPPQGQYPTTLPPTAKRSPSERRAVGGNGFGAKTVIRGLEERTGGRTAHRQPRSRHDSMRRFRRTNRLRSTARAYVGSFACGAGICIWYNSFVSHWTHALRHVSAGAPRRRPQRPISPLVWFLDPTCIHTDHRG